MLGCKVARCAVAQLVNTLDPLKQGVKHLGRFRKEGTPSKRRQLMIFINESGFYAFELSQNMQQLHFVVVAQNAITLFPSITQQKKAWRKSLRHAPIKENLIVKIEISYSSLVLCILRVEVGPTAHPVVAAIEGTDVGYGVETGPAGETCGTEQWTAGDRSIAICTYQ